MNVRTRVGFTLLEVLVSLAIIGLLVSILYVSFDPGRAKTRDTERQSDLKQLQLAIELYRSQNGRYPEQGCGGGTTWTGPGPHSEVWGNDVSCTEWIVGLVPEYIEALPQDPRSEMVDNLGYLYRTDATGSRYKILANWSVEQKQITGYGEDFARCPRNCTTGWCGATPQATTYGLYSVGAECW